MQGQLGCITNHVVNKQNSKTEKQLNLKAYRFFCAQRG